jgi:hypothetical protein
VRDADVYTGTLARCPDGVRRLGARDHDEPLAAGIAQDTQMPAEQALLAKLYKRFVTQGPEAM